MSVKRIACWLAAALLLVVLAIGVHGGLDSLKEEHTFCVPPFRSRPADLISFSGGFQQSPEQYASYCEGLAKAGYVVVVREDGGGLFPDHQQLVQENTELLQEVLANPPVPLSGKVFLAGHSLGAKVSVLTAAQVKADGIILIDPVDQGNPSALEEMPAISIPTLIIGETGSSKSMWGMPPCAPADANFQRFAEVAPWADVVQLRVGHMDFTDHPGGLMGFVCPAGPDPMLGDVPQATQQLMLDWLDEHYPKKY
jgi:dienelactone hydrolase